MKKPGGYSPNLRYHRLLLIVIGLVTLILVILMTISIYQENAQRQVRKKLDVRDEGERLAVEIERQVWRLSEECLRDRELNELASILVAATGPDDLHEANARLKEFSKRHPIADQLFMFQNGEVRFPQRSNQGTTYNVSPRNAIVEKQFAAIFKSAENEKGQGRFVAAVNTYQQAYDLAVPDGLKALALKNMAFCYVQMKKPTDAVRAYHQLQDRFGDYTDDNSRPFAVVAAIEIQKIAAKSSAAGANEFRQLYEQLINGRWLLSEEATRSCMALLEKQLGENVPVPKENPYLAQFQTAQSLENLLKAEQALKADLIQTRSVTQRDASVQVFYVPQQEGGKISRILALSVNRSHVSGPLLQECRALLQGGSSFAPDFQVIASGGSHESEVSIPFRTIFPFLELNLSKQAMGRSETREHMNLLVSISSIAMMLTLVGLISVLLFRVSRDIALLQSRNDFLSEMSHEQKIPLTLILFNSETLLADENLMQEERRQCYKTIHREAERLSNLIKNTLLFSGIEKQKQNYMLTEGDLGAVVDKTVQSCTDWLVEQGFTVKTEISPNLPPVRFDAEKVTQALMNLIDNARKYSGTTRSLDVKVRSENSEVIVSVRDSGRGISDAEKQRIFEKFYRGINAELQTGWGSGLYIVDNIMKAHTGRIVVESQVGYGSCFKLIFPASRA